MAKNENTLPLKFPSHFLWGAASSSHQVEGGNHNQWTVWELENAKSLASRAKYEAKYFPRWSEAEAEASNPHNYVSGLATDHYRRYKEDFALLKKLNMNAWRFSIEWSRIEPEEGAWNAEAIEHYRTYLKTLQKIGIEPIVTLWHWTLPVWFAQKGGFAKRSNNHYFVRFAQKVFEELGQDFRYVITFNEPEVYALDSYYKAVRPPQVRSPLLMTWVLLNMLAAHKRVYKLAKRTGRKYKISISKNVAYYFAGDKAWLSKVSAKVGKWAADYLILNRIKKQLDFIGVNFYFSNRYLGYMIHNLNKKQSDLGFELLPDKLQYVLEDLADRYDKPIIITENGLADKDDTFRQWWLSQTLLAMHRALQNGVKLEGYLHWSLTDNFEWSYGFWPRFGLAAVDYRSKKRTLRPSAVWLGGVIGKIRS